MNNSSLEIEIIELIENSRKTNTRIFFEKANEVKLGFKRRSTMIIGEDDTLLTENTKIADELKNIFKTILNQPNRNTIIENRVSEEQNLELPTRVEVDISLEMLKNEKVAGEDEIVSECLKKGGPKLIIQLHNKIH